MAYYELSAQRQVFNAGVDVGICSRSSFQEKTVPGGLFAYFWLAHVVFGAAWCQ